ncbi:MAG: nitroreductase family protein, partial [Lachnospiraceae bacterium]|nr:nitroreductase family protein [Lachnospiraceae bacterium]
IQLTDHGVAIDLSKCVRCGHCVSVCPGGHMENPLSPRQEPVGTPLPPAQAVQFLRTPRSVRYYREELVPREKLAELLDIGRYPQTGENSQGIRYLVVSGREKLDELNHLYCRLAREIPEDFPGYYKIQHTVHLQETYGHDALFYNSQHLILAISDESLETWRQNAQFSLTFISLLAPSLGLGTCWVGLLEFLACFHPYMEEFAEAVHLPTGTRICGCMLVGYPDVQFRRLVERDPLQIEWR